MSYDNAKACAVVETADVSPNLIDVDQKTREIQPERKNLYGSDGTHNSMSEVQSINNHQLKGM